MRPCRRSPKGTRPGCGSTHDRNRIAGLLEPTERSCFPVRQRPGVDGAAFPILWLALPSHRSSVGSVARSRGQPRVFAPIGRISPTGFRAGSAGPRRTFRPPRGRICTGCECPVRPQGRIAAAPQKRHSRWAQKISRPSLGATISREHSRATRPRKPFGAGAFLPAERRTFRAQGPFFLSGCQSHPFFTGRPRPLFNLEKAPARSDHLLERKMTAPDGGNRSLADRPYPGPMPINRGAGRSPAEGCGARAPPRARARRGHGLCPGRSAGSRAGSPRWYLRGVVAVRRRQG